MRPLSRLAPLMALASLGAGSGAMIAPSGRKESPEARANRHGYGPAGQLFAMPFTGQPHGPESLGDEDDPNLGLRPRKTYQIVLTATIVETTELPLGMGVVQKITQIDAAATFNS